jgi:hypothetical protein
METSDKNHYVNSAHNLACNILEVVMNWNVIHRPWVAMARVLADFAAGSHNSPNSQSLGVKKLTGVKKMTV